MQPADSLPVGIFRIALTGKDGQGLYAIVDEEDYDWLSMLTFSGHLRGRTVYAKTVLKVDGRRRKFALHRLIMQWYSEESIGGYEVDHINGNALDNRKENLRLACRGEQMRNTPRRQNKTSSRYKGVFKDGTNYRVTIRKDGIHYNCGHYKDERIAAIVYNLKARELFGEYARLNDVNSTVEEEAQVSALMHDAKRREGCSSRYRGVSISHGKTWRAAININGRSVKLGTFHTEEEAALAYNEAAIKHHGDKARLNVVP